MKRKARRTYKYDGPDPIDLHVGARMRLVRRGRGMTQSILAKQLGVGFQAVQKYEVGQVRLAASHLYRLAHALEVPLTYFFDGYEDAGEETGKRRKKGKR